MLNSLCVFHSSGFTSGTVNKFPSANHCPIKSILEFDYTLKFNNFNCVSKKSVDLLSCYSTK